MGAVTGAAWPSVTLVLVGLATLPGCFTAGYLAQAAGGQYELLHGARPIREVVASPDTPVQTKELLARVGDVKAWGRDQGLQPTKNYDRYTDLKRAAAVWVVQACAPLAFESKRWQFAIVGSVPYLGFFDEARARAYAAELARTEGLDVDVRGAAAYSTLGWFRDPVLSTMLSTDDDALGDLVNVVLHESVHATLYVKNQSAFDESLASFLGDHLTREWLVAHRGADARDTKAWLAAQERSRSRIARLHQVWVELDALYRSGVSEEEKRTGKARVIAEVTAELRLSRPLNNASLAGFETYATGTAGFARLLAACGTPRRMLRALRTVTDEDFGRPQQADFEPLLDGLAARACPRTGP